MGEKRRRAVLGLGIRPPAATAPVFMPSLETYAECAAFLREVADHVVANKVLVYVLAPGATAKDGPVVYHPAAVPAENVARLFQRVKLVPYSERRKTETESNGASSFPPLSTDEA
jgi:hypothetical protein